MEPGSIGIRHSELSSVLPTRSSFILKANHADGRGAQAIFRVRDLAFLDQSSYIIESQSLEGRILLVLFKNIALRDLAIGKSAETDVWCLDFQFNGSGKS